MILLTNYVLCDKTKFEIILPKYVTNWAAEWHCYSIVTCIQTQREISPSTFTSHVTVFIAQSCIYHIKNTWRTWRFVLYMPVHAMSFHILATAMPFSKDMICNDYRIMPHRSLFADVPVLTNLHLASSGIASGAAGVVWK